VGHTWITALADYPDAEGRPVDMPAPARNLANHLGAIVAALTSVVRSEAFELVSKLVEGRIENDGVKRRVVQVTYPRAMLDHAEDAAAAPERDAARGDPPARRH
jgi:hypothetical protein